MALAGFSGVFESQHHGPFNINFNFALFGQSYSLFIIGGSNLITLSNGITNWSASAHPWTSNLPYLNNYNKNAISLGFQLLEREPNDGSAIWYQTIGPPGQRRLVVSYCNVSQGLALSHPQCYPFRVTNQVILYEGSNVIEFHTRHMPASPYCPTADAGPDNAVQGLYYYNDANNTAYQVYSPGRAPGDNWGATGGSYTSRRFTPIPNAPYYKVDTIPYKPWNTIASIDTNAYRWYNAQGALVGQGPHLNAIATAPAGQEATFYVVKYMGAAGCDTVCDFTDTFWVHFAESRSTIEASICEGESYSFLGQTYYTAGNYDTVLVNHLGCDS